MAEILNQIDYKVLWPVRIYRPSNGNKLRPKLKFIKEIQPKDFKAFEVDCESFGDKPVNDKTKLINCKEIHCDTMFHKRGNQVYCSAHAKVRRLMRARIHARKKREARKKGK